METCDECGREVPVEEITLVPHPDGTHLHLCRTCYERSEYVDEDEA